MLTRKNLFLLPLVLLLIVSCGSDPLDVDASDVKVDIAFEDMRSSMQKNKGAKLMNVHRRYLKEMPDIYNYFLGACLGFQEGYADTTYLAAMERFQTDKGVDAIEQEIDNKFNNLKSIEAKLIDGFQHLKYHFPQGKIPTHIVFLNSLFRSSVWCTENEIGIGLGNYLGENSPTVKKLNPNVYYLWMKKAMRREYLERDVAENWIRTHYVPEISGTLAEHIIHEGKVMYLTKAAYPEMEDHLIMRYTREQWDWAEKNEFNFWDYLVQNQMLFKSEEITLMNLTNHGPKTPGLPIEGSPDRMGLYLGYKIVQDYMAASEIAVKDLIGKSAREIMNEYEPEK